MTALNIKDWWVSLRERRITRVILFCCRRFQYFLSVLPSPATWSVSFSSLYIGCSLLPAPMSGYNMSGTQVSPHMMQPSLETHGHGHWKLMFIVLQRKGYVCRQCFSGYFLSTLRLLSGWRSTNSILTPRTFHFILTCVDLLQLIGKFISFQNIHFLFSKLSKTRITQLNSSHSQI